MAKHNKGMKWLIGLLVVLSIATVVPIIHYHYVYPTAGDDTANHLFYFAHMSEMSPIYDGERLVGEALHALPINITIAFTWFHFLSFVAVLWIVGLSLAYSVNYIAGILSVLWLLIASGKRPPAESVKVSQSVFVSIFECRVVLLPLNQYRRHQYER